MRRLAWLAALALGIAANASAQAGRLSDKDAKDLMEAIDKGRDHIVDAFDSASVMGAIRAAIGKLNQAFGL